MRVVKAAWHLLAVLGLVTVAAGLWLWTSGIGTRTPPSQLETTVSRAARRSMIPSAARQRQAPHPPTPELQRAGMEHWADHCASCHANNGSGDTEMGRALYPPAPDMRLPATQDLSDGELFYIIEHGVKLTGMPAWGTGTAEGGEQSWHLVQFIRQLPQLTEDELTEMEAMNPRGPAEWATLEEERRFLSGDSPATAPPPTPHRHK